MRHTGIIFAAGLLAFAGVAHAQVEETANDKSLAIITRLVAGLSNQLAVDGVQITQLKIALTTVSAERDKLLAAANAPPASAPVSIVPVPNAPVERMGAGHDVHPDMESGLDTRTPSPPVVTPLRVPPRGNGTK